MLRAHVSPRRAGATARSARPARSARTPRAAPVGSPLALPAAVAPMLATAADRVPVDAHHYNFEWKWDGVRALAFIEPARPLRLQSRNLLDITVSYPELHALAGALPHRRARAGGVILDGEILALGDDGMPSFARLQRRMHVADPRSAARLAAQVPVWYVLFDILYVDGRSVMDEPYTRRRERLQALTVAGPNWQVTAAHLGEGAAMLAAAQRSRLEGIVAKRLDSPYEPGRRSRAWLKIKVAHRQELVVGGWVPELGTREHRVGSMLLGYHDDTGRLRYAGRVGTGLVARDHEMLSKLFGRAARTTSPFADNEPVPGARFIDPKFVVEVEYRRWPPDALIQQASYKGLRDDKDPREVVRETIAYERGHANDEARNPKSESMPKPE